MTKRMTSIRLGTLTDWQLSELLKAYPDMNQSELISIAIDRMHRDMVAERIEESERMNTQSQDYIIDHLNAEDWGEVERTFAGMTLPAILKELNDMFPQDENDLLAVSIWNEMNG